MGARHHNRQKKQAAAKAPAKKAPVKAPVVESSEEEEVELDDDELEANSDISSDDSAFVSDDEYDEDALKQGKRQKMFSDDEDESDVEATLTRANIEGLSKKLDLDAQAHQQQAQLELQESALQTNIAGDAADVFADADDKTRAGAGIAPDLSVVRTRINETIRILEDFKTLAAPGKSRIEYRELLVQDICTYYGYTPFLAEKLLNLFPAREAFAFFEANETPRPVVLRTNTLRTNRRSLAQALINRGVVLEPVGKWSKVGLQAFESPVPLGATPEYLAGHYILQAASSFLPVMALAPQPHERILDVAAAPGGKTTYISALMHNTGCVIANDANKVRAKGLIGNIHRLGVKNTIVSNLDGHAFPKSIGGFDRVLLDAPCSGTGVIAKDPSVKTSKTERDFMALPHLQKTLLLCAIDSTDHHSKTGGYIVYSTCSIATEENESVVQYALRKRPNVKIVDTGMGNFGSPGFKNFMGQKFDDKMSFAKRFFPHRENVDGFFVCKLKKTGPTPKDVGTEPQAASVKGTTTDEVTQGSVGRAPGAANVQEYKESDDEFGPFDEEEDKETIENARKRQLKRKGRDPKMDKKRKRTTPEDSEKSKST